MCAPINRVGFSLIVTRPQKRPWSVNVGVDCSPGVAGFLQRAIRFVDPVALRKASEIIIGVKLCRRGVLETWCSRCFSYRSNLLETSASLNSSTGIWRLTDTVIVSSQCVCGSDLVDFREHEAAAEASHKMRFSLGQQSGGCFFSVEVCGFFCCLTCPIWHGATQTCTRTRTTKTQSFSTLRNSQLKWRSWKRALRS